MQTLAIWMLVSWQVGPRLLRHTILDANLMSSSSLSRDALKALSVLGGLYKLKNCSGNFSENACDSIATDASEQKLEKGQAFTYARS